MRCRTSLIGLLLALCLMLCPGWAYSDTSSSIPNAQRKAFAKYLETPGAERVGSEQCAACHGDIAKNFRRTTHSQQDLQCEDCHGNGSLHAQSGDKTKIIASRWQKPEAASGICLSCHADNEHLANWSAGAHVRNRVRCEDCHKVHVAELKTASRREKNEACVRCHHKQEAEGLLPYHHPVREAKMGCDDCHNPHGGTGGKNLRASSVNELCLQCHAEFQGPFSFQHAPVAENCSKCHKAHGSAQRNLLTVSQPMLCLQCHSAHHNGSGFPLMGRCTNCHNAIHGTDIPSSTGGSLFMEK
jgi:DmsE family decaheme c-type cytochrome